MNEESFFFRGFGRIPSVFRVSFYSLLIETLHIVLSNRSSARHDDAQSGCHMLCHLGTVDHEER